MSEENFEERGPLPAEDPKLGDDGNRSTHTSLTDLEVLDFFAKMQLQEEEEEKRLREAQGPPSNPSELFGVRILHSLLLTH